MTDPMHLGGASSLCNVPDDGWHVQLSHLIEIDRIPELLRIYVHALVVNGEDISTIVAQPYIIASVREHVREVVGGIWLRDPVDSGRDKAVHQEDWQLSVVECLLRWDPRRLQDEAIWSRNVVAFAVVLRPCRTGPFNDKLAQIGARFLRERPLHRQVDIHFGRPLNVQWRQIDELVLCWRTLNVHAEKLAPIGSARCDFSLRVRKRSWKHGGQGQVDANRSRTLFDRKRHRIKGQRANAKGQAACLRLTRVTFTRDGASQGLHFKVEARASHIFVQLPYACHGYLFPRSDCVRGKAGDLRMRAGIATIGPGKFQLGRAGSAKNGSNNDKNLHAA